MTELRRLSSCELDGPLSSPRWPPTSRAVQGALADLEF